jgi:uncharacterized protein (DUF2342 family)
MALTPEQQTQADIQIAIETVRAANQTTLENTRTAVQAVAETKRTKQEMVRLAKEVLVENRRNLPVDQRGVTATDITDLATTLVAYINA